MGSNLSVSNPRVSSSHKIQPILTINPSQMSLSTLPGLKWPLPEENEYEDFVPNTRTNKQDYAFNRTKYQRDLLTTMKRPIHITSIKSLYPQKHERKETKCIESNVLNSSHVQMRMKAITDHWSGMAISNEMKRLLTRINVSNLQYNDILQQRLQALSREAENVLGIIIDQTNDEQQRLADYAQQIQQHIEELHREWLKKYILELDQWRARRLAQLHENLEKHKKGMDHVLQRKLQFVNQQVDIGRSEIFREERQRQLEETDHIMADVEDISRKNQMQHIGTKSNTNIHLNIRANAGNEILDSNEHSFIQDPDYPYLDYK